MSKDKDTRKDNKELTQIGSDPTNVFMIQNPQAVPPLTNASKDFLKNLLHASSIKRFNQQSEKWVDYLMQQKKLKEMVIKIKELNVGDEQKLPRYAIQLFPVYRKFDVNHFISNRAFQISGTFFNPTSQSFKDFMTGAKWNYRFNQFSVFSQLNLYGPWIIKAQQKWGKPIDKKFATDQRSFKLSYLLPHDSRRKNQLNPFEHLKSQLYFRMVGYDPRLKRTQIQQPGIYINQDMLKKIDILEAGYQRQLVKNNQSGSSGMSFNLGLGTDYYHTWYYKLKLIGRKSFQIKKKLGLLTYGELGFIDGKNVIPHEMFSRNQTKWLGERSRLYSYLRFDLVARGVPFFESLAILPSNYLKLWLSRSYQNKSKLELEIGISFLAVNSPFKIDLNFFRMSGVHGEPRFGLKYEF